MLWREAVRMHHKLLLSIECKIAVKNHVVSGEGKCLGGLINSLSSCIEKLESEVCQTKKIHQDNLDWLEDLRQTRTNGF